LAEKAKPMLEMGPALPNGMVEVAQEILKTSKSLQETMVNDLSETFDAVREKKFSLLRLGLKRSNCENLEKGAMSAVVRFSLKLGDQSDDAHEDRREEFEKFAKQCPWLRTLAANPDIEVEAMEAAESHEEEAEEVEEEHMEKLEKMSGDSVLELKDSVDPVSVAAFGAMVCAVLVVAGILMILLGGLFCQLRVWLSNKKSVTAEDMCRKQEKVDTCYSAINQVGCVLIIGGFMVLMICWPESALLTTMLAALGVVTNLQSNGDTGPTFYSRPNLYWWYMPPMYIHKGGGGYSGPGNALTDEEKANFDYQTCLQVRGSK